MVAGISDYLKKIWALSIKDMRLYYFKGPTIVMGIIMPMFLWLAFMIGSSPSMGSAVAMLLSISSFFAASSITPVILPWETRQKTLEMILARPITIELILLGTCLASMLYGVFVSLVIIVIGIFLGVCPANIPVLIVSILLSSICYSFMGLLFSAIPSDVPADAVLLSSVIRMPLIFISGVFVPINRLPAFIRPLSYISPLTYYADVINKLYIGNSAFNMGIDFSVLLLLTIILGIFTIETNRRTIIKRL